MPPRNWFRLPAHQDDTNFPQKHPTPMTAPNENDEPTPEELNDAHRDGNFDVPDDVAQALVTVNATARSDAESVPCGDPT